MIIIAIELVGWSLN